MSEKSTEGDILARVRTLYALERNYLAMVRNQLAKIRTGLALSLFAPPIYVYSLSLHLIIPFFLIILFLIILISSGSYGLWMIFHAHTKLTKIRKLLQKVRKREDSIIKSSPLISELLGDLSTDLTLLKQNERRE